MEGLYRFAGRAVAVSTLLLDTHDLCAGYRTEGPADFSVATVEADIAFERERSLLEEAREGLPHREYPEGYLETLAVYRKIAERMPEYDTILFHGSCVAVDGLGYLFTAKSGTGKSTHTRLWRERFGNRAVMVNDDKPLLRIAGDGVTVYGTPWDGKHRLSADLSVPLQGLCILERAKENAIRPITAAEAYPMLLQQAYRPMNSAAMAKTLLLIDRLAAAVPLWRLGCNLDSEAAQVAYDAMKGN